MSERKAGIIPILLGGAIELANYYPTASAAVESLKAAGGTGGLMADLLLSPLFGLALIVLGFVWLFSSPSKGQPQAPSVQQAPSVVTQNVSQSFAPSVNVNVPAEHAVRFKYSSQQVIAISNDPAGHNDSLNLDNVATMTQGQEATANEVGMFLISSPPLTVDKPTAEGKYEIGGGYYVQFPAAGESWIDIAGAKFHQGGEKYLFNRFGSSSHVVEVGARRFRVALVDMKDESNKEQKLWRMVYTFGISEV
jgi:hypothetical protein